MGELKFTLIDKAEIPPPEANKRSKYRDMVRELLANQEKSICLPATSKAKAQALRVLARSGIESALNRKEPGGGRYARE